MYGRRISIAYAIIDKDKIAAKPAWNSVILLPRRGNKMKCLFKSKVIVAKMLNVLKWLKRNRV